MSLFEGQTDEQPPVEILTDAETFVVVTDGYEGPMDLLLALAREQKVDLRQISILALVDQFIAFVAGTPDLRLDLAADYVVMAAWLALLKSRLLLPQDDKPDERRSAEDDARELAAQLRRLAILRKAVETLGDGLKLGRDWMTPGTLSRTGPRRASGPNTVGLLDLLASFVREAKRNAPPIIPALEHIDLRTVDEALHRLAAIIAGLDGWKRLIDMLPDGGAPLRRRSEAATHFVAMLELCRVGQVEFRQEELFGAIWMRRPTEQQQ